MKGQKAKDDAKYRFSNENEKHTGIVKFYYLDFVPIIFDRENVMKWLAETGWIEGLVWKYKGDQFPFFDDYVQELYLLIFDKIDKLIEIYETRGILAFCGYIKMIIFTQCFSDKCYIYNKIRKPSREIEIGFDPEVLNDIYDTYNPDTMTVYKFTKTNDIN